MAFYKYTGEKNKNKYEEKYVELKTIRKRPR